MMPSEGKYIYCIADTQEEKYFNLEGIGDRGDKVHSVVFKDLGAVVSSTPLVKYPISKENTTVHMKVMEMIMKDYTVLPVKFGTIAPNLKKRSAEERIKLEILKARDSELKELLAQMERKVELGLKAIWVDMNNIYSEIAGTNKEIKLVKQRISCGNFRPTYSQRIRLGEMVKKALDEKRIGEEAEIIKSLDSTFCISLQNKIFGDNMITNSSFLVDKNRVKEFDSLMERLISTYGNRIRFKYVGPIPPCNFVELVINLKGNEQMYEGEEHL